MNYKVIYLILLSLSFSCKAQENRASVHSQKNLVNDRINSKKHVLCMCLQEMGYIAKDSITKQYKTYSYFEKKTRHPMFYKDLVSFTKQEIIKKNYKSFQGDHVVLKLALCIDFFNSKELEDYIISIESKKYD